MALPAWKDFLHLKWHCRKSSPEGNSVPDLSESGLKPCGVGPGFNSCAASHCHGAHQHAQKSSEYLVCKLPSVVPKAASQGAEQQNQRLPNAWGKFQFWSLITGIHRFCVKLLPWLPVLQLPLVWVSQGSDQIWPHKENICFSVGWWPNSVPFRDGTRGTNTTFHPAPAEQAHRCSLQTVQQFFLCF